MTTISSVVLEAQDVAAAEAFYNKAFDVADHIGVREASPATSTGFRGFSVSLVVSQPSVVDSFASSAVEAGAAVVKPVEKSFWGYGGVVRAPDGALWKVASSAKKNTRPTSRHVDDIVLLLGVADVKAAKRFYVEHGFEVSKSFGSKYVEFTSSGSAIKLALYGRRHAAKDAGVAAEGSGSHRIVIGSDAGSFVDPDGYVWEAA